MVPIDTVTAFPNHDWIWLPLPGGEAGEDNKSRAREERGIREGEERKLAPKGWVGFAP